MMRMCTTCGTPRHSNMHTCPPQFEVLMKGTDPQYADSVYARTAEEAATKWAEAEEFAGLRTERVKVLDVAHQTVTWFDVVGEMVPEYTATEVEVE